MTPFKYTTETVIRCDYKEIERIVQKHYKVKNWSIVADQECNNDSSLSFSVRCKLDKYDKERVKDFKKDDDTFMSNALLDNLCFLGLIPEGEYIVDVMW
jgi:hypothetical protein